MAHHQNKSDSTDTNTAEEETSNDSSFFTTSSSISDDENNSEESHEKREGNDGEEEEEDAPPPYHFEHQILFDPNSELNSNVSSLSLDEHQSPSLNAPHSPISFHSAPIIPSLLTQNPNETSEITGTEEDSLLDSYTLSNSSSKSSQFEDRSKSLSNSSSRSERRTEASSSPLNEYQRRRDSMDGTNNYATKNELVRRNEGNYDVAESDSEIDLETDNSLHYSIGSSMQFDSFRGGSFRELYEERMSPKITEMSPQQPIEWPNIPYGSTLRNIQPSAPALDSSFSSAPPLSPPLSPTPISRVPSSQMLQKSSSWSLIRHFSTRQLPIYRSAQEELPSYEAATANSLQRSDSNSGEANVDNSNNLMSNSTSFTLQLGSSQFLAQKILAPILSRTSSFRTPSAPPLGGNGTLRLSHNFVFPKTPSFDAHSVLTDSPRSSKRSSGDFLVSPPSNRMTMSESGTTNSSASSPQSGRVSASSSSVDISLKSSDGVQIQKKTNKDAQLEILAKSAGDFNRNAKYERNQCRKLLEMKDKEMNAKHASEIKQLEMTLQAHSKQLAKERASKGKETLKKVKISKSASKTNVSEENLGIPKEVSAKQLSDALKENQKWLQDYIAIEDLEIAQALELKQLQIVLTEKIKRFKERVSLDFLGINTFYLEDRRTMKFNLDHNMLVFDRKHSIHLEDLNERFQTSKGKLIKNLSNQRKLRMKEFKKGEKVSSKQENEELKMRMKQEFNFDRNREKMLKKQRQSDRVIAFTKELDDSEEQAHKELLDQFEAERKVIIEDDSINRKLVAQEILEKESEHIDEHYKELHTRSRSLRIQIDGVVDADLESLLMMLESQLEEVIGKHETTKKNFIVLLNCNYTLLASQLRDSNSKRMNSKKTIG
eukprot:TRINITY_DN4918_c0_g1_i2.p1 TRINITY_DN4918_c0_g1~~TRINITY_DN4918_c0_g1_i2.p1  ORF type:complete len:885 (+),score=364.28 TRINITY_DN4918_c0_g1_i2:100-2754(+)